MCTVTIVPLNAVGKSRSVRIACNRDELRTRPLALPPRMQSFGARRAILPIDPASGGTWIAVSDIGVLLTVLNVNLAPGGGSPGARDLRSRGTIIPELLPLDSLNAMVAAASTLATQRYAPFRLVLVDRERIADVYSDGRDLRCTSSDLGALPVFYTSSGLGDALVESPRRALFDQTFALPLADPITVQDAFHRHTWPDRRHLSVCMERAEATTVSHTVVELQADACRLTYTPGMPDRTPPLPQIEFTTEIALA